MALTDKVIFGIDDNRIEAKYNKEHLRLGATVYVTKDNCIENFVFSIHQQEKSIPYYVTWISPSTWYVVLKSQYSLDERLVSNTIQAVSKYMNTSDVRLALEFAAKEICPERMFMTKEYERSRLAAISSVIKRLDLCDRLWSFQVRKEIFYHHLSLISYLLLTCFDILGQPANWLDFGSWLNTKKTSYCVEQDEVLKDIEKKSLDPISITKAFYSYYCKKYGTKNSFFSFLHEILPRDSRRILLCSFSISELDNPPSLGNRRFWTDKEKERYLFIFRNKYTHRAEFIEGICREILDRPSDNITILGAIEQNFEAHKWFSVDVIESWPSPIKEAVKAGLASYLNKIIISNCIREKNK